MAAKRFQTLYFELGGITKHLMTGPSGNSEFCFPSSLNVPLGFASGNIEVSGKQNSLFPLGPIIKCLLMYFIETRQVGLVQESANYGNATKNFKHDLRQHLNNIWVL